MGSSVPRDSRLRKNRERETRSSWSQSRTRPGPKSFANYLVLLYFEFGSTGLRSSCKGGRGKGGGAGVERVIPVGV